MVVSELRGEKIDIIPYNEEPARFVAKALSPARVREVLVDDENRQATVIVPDDQLSLAIGREGQNARLAAKLTGWRVDIVGESEFAERAEDEGFEEEEEVSDGRCAAVLSAGRRCPNAALGGSRYCGLPQHQSLARFATNQVTLLGSLSNDEIQMLANPEPSEDEIEPHRDPRAGRLRRGRRGRGGRGRASAEATRRPRTPRRPTPAAEEPAEEERRCRGGSAEAVADAAPAEEVR